MTNVLRFLFPAIAILLILTAVALVLRALSARSRISRQPYGVAQIEVRRRMKIDLLWAVGVMIGGAVVLGIWGLLLTTADPEPEVLPPPTVTSMPSRVPTGTATSVVVTNTPPSQPTSTATIRPSPTPSSPAATTAPSPESNATVTVAAPTALVSSEVGIYLRGEPNTEGEQLEWVLDGTLLLILPGRETGPEFEWQQVRTPAGNEGWVAVPFIQYNQ